MHQTARDQTQTQPTPPTWTGTYPERPEGLMIDSRQTYAQGEAAAIYVVAAELRMIRRLLERYLAQQAGAVDSHDLHG